jgi:hypothetical protein
MILLLCMMIGRLLVDDFLLLISWIVSLVVRLSKYYLALRWLIVVCVVDLGVIYLLIRLIIIPVIVLVGYLLNQGLHVTWSTRIEILLVMVFFVMMMSHRFCYYNRLDLWLFIVRFIDYCCCTWFTK